MLLLLLSNPAKALFKVDGCIKYSAKSYARKETAAIENIKEILQVKFETVVCAKTSDEPALIYDKCTNGLGKVNQNL